MSINTSELRALPPLEKLQIVEMLWDDLGDSSTPIPLPDWVADEAANRRDEMAKDASVGISHDEVWRRIDGRRE